MFSDTRQALLDAIRDQPFDDAPRLIYADWIEEHGDPERGKFIRLQCDHARMPEWHPQRNKLGKQCARLEKKHGQRWLQELPENIGDDSFHRGFLYSVRL